MYRFVDQCRRFPSPDPLHESSVVPPFLMTKLPPGLLGRRFLRRLLISLLCIFCGLPAWSQDTTAASPERPQLLVLISRGPSDLWASSELDGMLRVFREAKPAIHPIVEYMDWQAGSTPEQESKLAAYYASKFNKLNIRAVIANGEPAL